MGSCSGEEDSLTAGWFLISLHIPWDLRPQEWFNGKTWTTPILKWFCQNSGRLCCKKKADLLGWGEKQKKRTNDDRAASVHMASC